MIDISSAAKARTLFLLLVWELLTPARIVCGASPDQLKPDQLRLIPFPKVLLPQPGRFSLRPALNLEAPRNQGAILGDLLNEELKRAGLSEAKVVTLDMDTPAFRLAVAKGPWFGPVPMDETNQAGLNPAVVDWGESYGIEIRAHEIVCEARKPEGLLHGLQTLRQLLRANRSSDTLPCLKIRDWPSLRWRGFQDDLTRGPSSQLDTLKFEAGMGSFLKLNLMTYYMEYQFAFKKHPGIGPPDGSLTAEELAALVEYSRPLHLEILGNQQSFGHFGRILELPSFARLKETADVLTPVREETYQLLDDLYSEVCPVLPFPWFNVCCDETDGLGTGPSRELVAQIGVGGVYVRHLRRLHDLLRDKYRKRMMMWGDIILQHPGNLLDLPKDTILLSWGYDARASFDEQIVPFAKSGYEFFVCPGVSDWNRILPDFGVAATNIHHFVRDGVKHGALGMLNTDWEDDAEALKAVKWYADAWAAECAWNASATPLEAFNRRIGAVLFGEKEDHFGRAIELLARTQRLPAMKDMFNARFWEQDFVPKANPIAIQATTSNLLTLVRPALEHLQTCKREATCNQHVLDVFEFGARRMELIGLRMLDGCRAAQLFERAASEPTNLQQVQSLLRKNRDAHQSLGAEFARLWRAESKPYALDWTLQRYTNMVEQYQALINNLDRASSNAVAGQPFPSAEEIGLAAPAPRFRRVLPRETLSAALAPEAAWADPSASHRLGLVVGTGEADRFDLPVEVDLSLPADLVNKPVRAFVLTGDATPQEVPAQLDRTGSRGKARLVFMLPGPLPKGVETRLHLYLGLYQKPPSVPGAVVTRSETNNMQTIENDQLRLWLGTEGAHVYRWEVKAAGYRDVTMPGETDWAGFGDIYNHRHAAYTLECKARGPAMVEFECSDPWGHVKLLRAYAGVSWIEVLLNEATSVYWDFDDPKNFAADGPTPGNWLFSDGQTGRLGREAEGVSAQVKVPNTCWGMKYNAGQLALGLVTPEIEALHVVAPGDGAGGAGIEGSPPATHFVTFAGILHAPPADTMNRLRTNLDLTHLPEVRIYSLQPAEPATRPRAGKAR